jgi:uncharacterized protein (TIGR00369 family)
MKPSMADQTPFDPEQFVPLMASAGHPGFLGLTYCDKGENWVELELPWRADLLGEDDSEILASGPIISLWDMASGLAIWTTRKHFTPFATLDLRVDYIRPAKAKASVIGRADCYRLTKSAAFVRGLAHDGDPDDPLAHFAAVFMSISPGKAPPKRR